MLLSLLVARVGCRELRAGWRELPHRRRAHLELSPCAFLMSPMLMRLTEIPLLALSIDLRRRRRVASRARLSSALFSASVEIARRRDRWWRTHRASRPDCAERASLSGRSRRADRPSCAPVPRILSRLSTRMPSTWRRPWVMSKIRLSTVSLAAAKFFSARSCWVRAMMPAVTAPTASRRSRAAAETASESARRCWRTSWERRSSLGVP